MVKIGSIVVLILALLVWLNADSILNLFEYFKAVDPEVRKTSESWLRIIAAIFAIIITMINAPFAIKNLRKVLKGDSIDSRTLYKEYYQALYNSCESIDLSLVDSKFKERQSGIKNHFTLPVVYQEMDVVSCDHEKQDGDKQHNEDALQLKSIKETRKPLIEAVSEDEYNRVVILGDPGSGKSMFIDNLSWQIAASQLNKSETSLSANFQHKPILRIRLRSIAMQCRNGVIDSEVLIVAMKQDIAVLLNDENKAEQLWTSLKVDLFEFGIILFDGLDEVPVEKGIRKEVLEAIVEIEKQLGEKAKLIITSRTYVFEDDYKYWLSNFKCLDLQKMSSPQVESFINNWYLLLRKPTHTQENVLTEAHSLYLDLLDRESLLDPARSPLILTLLISMHHTKGILPHSRAELYKEAIDLMLERWTSRISLEHPDYPLDSYIRKAIADDIDRKLSLQKLAMSAHSKETLQIPVIEIHGLFSKHVEEDMNATVLFDFIRYQSGILKPGKDQNHFEFYHRSFQDYLAALEIAEMTDWQDKIINYLKTEGKDWWEQTYLLLVSAKVSGGSKPDAVNLISRCMPDNLEYQTYSTEQWEWLFLAAKATIEQQKPLIRYAESPYLQLRKHLSNSLLYLVESDREQNISLREKAGMLLGELGDPREGVTIIKNKEGKPKRFRNGFIPDIDWVDIPEGNFKMGLLKKEVKNSWDEFATPRHKVSVKFFEVSRYPVTNAQYECFIKAGGYENDEYWRDTKESLGWLKNKEADLSLFDDNPDLKKQYKEFLDNDTDRTQPYLWEEKKWNNPNHPVVGICWYEALAFCRWLETTEVCNGSKIRLPTEVEWEYMARGSDNYDYSWGGGSSSDQPLGNYSDTGLNKTSTVGLFSKGLAFGLHDLSGNIWEWTSSRWGENSKEPGFIYQEWKNYSDKERDKLDTHSLRVIRGGSYYSSSDYVRCAIRDRILPYFRLNGLGFRVVRM